MLSFTKTSLNIPFVKIESFQPAKGIAWINTTSFVTSFNSQVEIKRKIGMKVRFSPSKREMFLEHLNRAINDWRRTQP